MEETAKERVTWIKKKKHEHREPTKGVNDDDREEEDCLGHVLMVKYSTSLFVRRIGQ